LAPVSQLRPVPTDGAEPPPERRPDFPAVFAAALDAIRAVHVRRGLTLVEAPAPARLAPFAAAVAATIHDGDDELAKGRLIVLHDPAGHEAWEGTLRLVTYIRTELEAELVTDALLPEVAWQWLVDALVEHGVELTTGSGTVTRVQSHPFGALANDDEDEPEGELEIRASWCPTGDVTAHVQAWLDVLCTAAGLPPASEELRVTPSTRDS
jgi:DUF3000 family protein